MANDLFVRDSSITLWKLRDDQYEMIKKICKRPYGLIQLPTGFGKNVLITYMVTHYNGTGNILIVVPTKSIGEEIFLRFKQCGILNVNETRIKYVQASGFVASNYFQTEECNKFLENVEMVLVDEAENVASSMNKILAKCINAKVFYGFSATSDRFNNKKLSYENLKGVMHTLHQETMNLMYYFGTTSVFKSPDKLINVYQTYLPIPPEEKLWDWQKMQAVPKAVENVIHCNSFIRYFDYIKGEEKDKVLFVPVKTIAQGQYLLKHCNDNAIDAVFWSGSGIVSTKNIADLKIDSYAKLKDYANKHRVHTIIATQVGFKGIDIKAITDILLVIGTNASVVNQIIGRAYRTEEDIRLWLLNNANDRYVDWRKNASELSTPIYNACNGARMKQINASQKYTLHTIDIRYSLNEQLNKTTTKETMVDDCDIGVVSKKEQSMDSDQKTQNKIFEMLRNRKS